MEPLASLLNGPDQTFDVIVWLNESFRGGAAAAAAIVHERIQPLDAACIMLPRYCCARLDREQILALAEETRQIRAAGKDRAPIFQIWHDNEIHTTLTHSLATVKADAAQRAFRAMGEGVVWAVIDSGIDGAHPHFSLHRNLELPPPLAHCDFTEASDAPLCDEVGHGTHVAGIIAGELRDAEMAVSGVAPRARLLSLKVVGPNGAGRVSAVLRALDRIMDWNQQGARLHVDGANLSLGYDFDPRWFACGQSPLCVEVNRLVRSGVSVVTSAGNAGYGSFLASSGESLARFSDLSITDPGNAELAITVGSTHREMPHTYGVSYFSSRGPTGDGRMKPDLLAPGERILSCAAGRCRDAATALYCEQSGTSMAAPHVSGAVAAFLSVRPEFRGETARIKRLFVENTVDLGRDRRFQGAGLLDLMKVLQGV